MVQFVLPFHFWHVDIHATDESCHCAGIQQTELSDQVCDPKWWFSKGNPLISGKSRLVKYYNLARFVDDAFGFWGLDARCVLIFANLKV